MLNDRIYVLKVCDGTREIRRELVFNKRVKLQNSSEPGRIALP